MPELDQTVANLDEALAKFRRDHHGAVTWEITEALFANTGGPFIRRGMVVGQAFTQWRLYVLWYDTTARMYATSGGFNTTATPEEPLRPIGETNTYVHSEDWNAILHQFNPDAHVSSVQRA
ncbi:hypothetical protein [Aeromicrobium sp. 179-A 4D2 NHS]|uniref:hypothetical protein n=1 Tax=Aeromicrobium sp. 179-A 4D2 NHS TaxID=3142375 RepID=UPI00399F388C